MSEVWLVVAIGCVFGAVVLFGIFFDLNQSERRRAVRCSSRRSPAPRPRT